MNPVTRQLRHLAPVWGRSILLRSLPSETLQRSRLRPWCGVAHPPHRSAHTVRVIVQKDVEGGKAYAGDVIKVKAGYARNYLLPQKYAVYATRHNFVRLGLHDPDHKTPDERRARLEREAAEGSDKDLKARDVLSKYLRNKTLRLWRNVDAETNRTFPGMVDARAVRKKLSRQLKIDLEPHERIHLVPEPVESLSDLREDVIEALMEEKLGNVASDQPCTVQIRQIGDFLARITLSGGYTVPLKFEVAKR
jgi:ribosomal protein L9